MKNKRHSLISILLTVLLCMGTIVPMLALPASASVQVNTDWYDNAAEGVGDSETTPYEIETANDLAGLASLVNGTTPVTFEGKFIKLTSDIVFNVGDASDWAQGNDIADLNEWTPIGNSSSKYFMGTFDGGNYSISGLYYPSGTTRSGLFGEARGATIKNVNLVNSYLTSEGTSGGILGYAKTTQSNIQNCHCDAIITSTGTGVGGIVGQSAIKVTVSNCSFSGSITAQRLVGGIFGNAGADIEIASSVNYGNVSGTSTNTSHAYQVGGIVGYGNYGTKLTSCVNVGNVSSCGGNYTTETGKDGSIYGAGALVGRINANDTVTVLDITTCYVQNGHYAIGNSDTQPTVTTFNSIFEIPATIIPLAKKLDHIDFIQTLGTASVRLGNPTGMRFLSKINGYSDLTAAGGSVSEIATVIAPTGFITSGTLVDLHKAGDATKYLVVPATVGTWFINSEDTEGTYIAGTISNMDPSNYSRDFSAVAYCTVTLGNETVTVYSDVIAQRNVAYVAGQALEDTTKTYTDAQKQILTNFTQAATE